jgi:hypothetical protein
MANLFPLMPAHLRPTFKCLIPAIPEPWLLALKSGKIFELEEICKKRLQAFALAQGFAVAVSKSHRDRSIFHCIHHGASTYNDRGLKPRVARDGEGGGVSEKAERYLLPQERLPMDVPTPEA